MPRLAPLLAIAIVAANPLAAQQSHTAAKPTLTSADYAKWETLGAGALSPDGKWVAYDFRRANGTTELRYRGVDASQEQSVRSANGPQFSANSRWMLYTITPDTAGGRGGRGGRAADAVVAAAAARRPRTERRRRIGTRSASSISAPARRPRSTTSSRSR